jgi:hypothetical protein
VKSVGSFWFRSKAELGLSVSICGPDLFRKAWFPSGIISLLLPPNNPPEHNERMEDESGATPVTKPRRRWLRGSVWAATVMMSCYVFADIYVAIALVGRTGLIRWPFDEMWWKAMLCLPAGAVALWAFSRPLRAP